MKLEDPIPRVLVCPLVFLVGFSAQAPSTTLLTDPDAEFSIAYSSVTAIRELPGNRVLILEDCERAARLLEWETGHDLLVGKIGSGPGEYRSASRLFPFFGDSSVLYDDLARRFLVLDADGKVQRTFEAPPRVRLQSMRGALWPGFEPEGVDSRGYFYSREAALRPTATNFVRSDTVALERWDPIGGGRDTVAFVRVRARPVAAKPEQAPTFDASADAWAVAADGRIALVHPEKYQVEFISPSGGRYQGPPNPYRRVPLKESYKKEWRDRQLSRCPRSSGFLTTLDGRIVSARPTRLTESPEWPSVLPPFLPDAARFSQEGVLWVLRVTDSGRPSAYDLIDRSGRVVHRVLFGRRSRVVGFGKGVVFTVRTDQDDLQYIERYPLPKALSQ